MDHISEIRTKQSFLENGFQSISLVGGAVDHDLFVGRAGKEKGINNKLEIEIVFSLNKGSYRKHIFGGKRFGPPAEILDNSRGASEANRLESLDLQNPKIIALVYTVPFRICHNLVTRTPGSKLQVHRGSRKTKRLPQAVRQISAV
jgi:hypothetical protein